MLGLKEGNVFVDDTVKMLSKAIIMSSAAACGMVVVRPGVLTVCIKNSRVPLDMHPSRNHVHVQ